jgi:hypothetical protein
VVVALAELVEQFPESLEPDRNSVLSHRLAVAVADLRSTTSRRLRARMADQEEVVRQQDLREMVPVVQAMFP